MASAKGRIVRLLSGWVLERGAVVSVQGVGNFQRLLLRCDVPAFSAGKKVQLLLPSDDVRTFTPIPSPEGLLLLGWKHGSGPAARWLADVRAGDELPFLGPQRSLELDAGPVVVVGDETSVAVAATFAAERPGQVHAIFQADAASDVRDAAASVGLREVVVVARGDTAATLEAVTRPLSTFPNACVALTGGSELVAGVRNALRNSGVRNIKTKAYWIPGRAGLD